LGVARSIARNTAILVTGNTSVRAISFLVTIYLARFLCVEGYGKYSFVTTYVSFFAILANLGIGQILTREISKRPRESAKLVGSATTLAAVLSLGSIAACILIINLAGYPADVRLYVLVLSSTLIMDSTRASLASLFRANLRMEYQVLSNLADRVLSFLGIFWVILSRGSLLEIFTIITVSRLLALLVTYVAARGFVKPELSFDWKTWKYFLRESWPVAVQSGFATVYIRVDRIMLQVMEGNAAVGYYSVAYRLVETLQVISLSLQYSIFPLMSKYLQVSKAVFRKIYILSFRYATILSFVIAMVGVQVSRPIVRLFFGEQYLPAANALIILLWAMIFIFLVGIYNRIVIASGRQVLTIYLCGGAAFMNVALNLVLIPVLGFTGAALSTLVSYAMVPAGGFLFKDTAPFSRALFRLVGKSAVAATPFLLILSVAGGKVALPVGLPIYLVIIISLGDLRRQDVAFFRKVLWAREPEDSDQDS